MRNGLLHSDTNELQIMELVLQLNLVVIYLRTAVAVLSRDLQLQYNDSAIRTYICNFSLKLFTYM